MNPKQRKDRIAKHAALHDAHRARSSAHETEVFYAKEVIKILDDAGRVVSSLERKLEEEKRESRNLLQRLRCLTRGTIDVFPDDLGNKVVTAQLTISRRHANLMYLSATDFMADALYQVCADLGKETIKTLCKMFTFNLQKPLIEKRDAWIQKSVYEGWKNQSQATPADYGRAWDSALNAIMEAATPKQEHQ